MIRIAKIVKSNSHVDYVGRVIDRARRGGAADGRGLRVRAVRLDAARRSGRARWSASSTTRSSPTPTTGVSGRVCRRATELPVLSPDYLNEQGVLARHPPARLARRGRWREAATARGGRGQVITECRGGSSPSGRTCTRCRTRTVREFHRGEDGSVRPALLLAGRRARGRVRRARWSRPSSSSWSATVRRSRAAAPLRAEKITLVATHSRPDASLVSDSSDDLYQAIQKGIQEMRKLYNSALVAAFALSLAAPAAQRATHGRPSPTSRPRRRRRASQ